MRTLHTFMHSPQAVQLAEVTSSIVSTGMPMGHAAEQRPQSAQPASPRRMRRRPTAEKGCNTAAKGQSQRQKGSATAREATTMPPEITYAQILMSSPLRLMSA